MPDSLDNGKQQLSTQWVRGEPGELAPVNRELLDRIEDLIRDNGKGEVLGIVSGWGPGDVRDLGDAYRRPNWKP